MKLTQRIKGKFNTRLDQAKELGAKRLLEWNDVVEIYKNNDKENIKILEQDMQDSWLTIPTPEILLSKGNSTIKRIAGNRTTDICNIKKSNEYVRLSFVRGGFDVSGSSWTDNNYGFSHGVSSVSEAKPKNNKKKCPHCKGTGMVKRK